MKTFCIFLVLWVIGGILYVWESVNQNYPFPKYSGVIFLFTALFYFSTASYLRRRKDKQLEFLENQVKEELEFFSFQEIQDEIILGLTLSFLRPLIYASQSTIPDNENDEIIKIINEKRDDSKYYLINFCNRVYHLEGNRDEAFSDLLSSCIETSEEVKNLSLNNEKSILEMYRTVEKFVRNIQEETLKQIIEIIKAGSKEYYQMNKYLYEKEEHNRSIGKKIWEISLEIFSEEHSLYISTGMFISTALSQKLGKTGLKFFP